MYQALAYPNAIGDEATLTKAAWLDVRHTGIGGSDAASILGVSPWKSRYALWSEKSASMPPPPLTENDAMRFGTMMEPHLRRLFADVTGLQVVEDTTIYQHPEHSWMLANLDGVVLDDFTGEPAAVLEIKTASRPQGWANGVPAYYRAQVIHYRAVTNPPKAYVGVLLAGSEFKVYEIDRDEAEVNNLIAAEAEFWRSLGKDEPELDGHDSTRQALTDAFTADGSEINLDPSLSDLFEKRAGLKQDADAVAEEIKATEAAIMRALGDAEIGLLAGKKVVTWKPQSRTTIDSKALKAEMPDIAERFSKTSSSRILRIMWGV